MPRSLSSQTSSSLSFILHTLIPCIPFTALSTMAMACTWLCPKASWAIHVTQSRMHEVGLQPSHRGLGLREDRMERKKTGVRRSRLLVQQMGLFCFKLIYRKSWSCVQHVPVNTKPSLGPEQCPRAKMIHRRHQVCIGPRLAAHATG